MRGLAEASEIGCVVLNRDVEYLTELRSIYNVPIFGITSDHKEIGRIQGRQFQALDFTCDFCSLVASSGGEPVAFSARRSSSLNIARDANSTTTELFVSPYVIHSESAIGFETNISFPSTRLKRMKEAIAHFFSWRKKGESIESRSWTKGATRILLIAGTTSTLRSEGVRKCNLVAQIRKCNRVAQAQFKHEVDKLTNKDTEPCGIVSFKLYKSQLPVVEQALETAGLMLGSDKCCGYCLEMICADFLAGAHAQEGSPELLPVSMVRLYRPLRRNRDMLSPNRC